jgi:hypothetical protein
MKHFHFLMLLLVCGIYEQCFAQVPPQNYDNDIVPGPQQSQVPANCTKSSTAFTNTYGRLNTYIPTAATPVKTIKVNFNIFQDGAGGGNFMSSAQDGGIDVARLNTIFGWIRGFYQGNQTPTDNTIPVTPLPHEYIDFELGGIYFYNNASLYYSTSQTALIQEISNTDPSRLNSLNICFNGACWYAKVSAVTMVTQGTGYTSAPLVAFNPTGATGTAIIDGSGHVTGVTMTTVPS